MRRRKFAARGDGRQGFRIWHGHIKHILSLRRQMILISPGWPRNVAFLGVPGQDGQLDWEWNFGRHSGFPGGQAAVQAPPHATRRAPFIRSWSCCCAMAFPELFSVRMVAFATSGSQAVVDWAGAQVSRRLGRTLVKLALSLWRFSERSSARIARRVDRAASGLRPACSGAGRPRSLGPWPRRGVGCF